MGSHFVGFGRPEVFPEKNGSERAERDKPQYICIYTDGSQKSGLAAAACVVFAAWDAEDINPLAPADHWAEFCGTVIDVHDACALAMPDWRLVMTKGRYLGQSTITNAELVGIEEACSIMETFISM